jgi:hypothetical protein
MPMQRPLSPFMFPTWYRFQLTSALSILHRLTGIALAVGSILLSWWLVAVAAGGELFEITHAFIRSPIGMCRASRRPFSIANEPLPVNWWPTSIRPLAGSGSRNGYPYG